MQGVKLQSGSDGTIAMNQMRCGQLAMIASGNHTGEIVQLISGFGTGKDIVQAVGKPRGTTWSDGIPETLRVRVLKAGDVLTVN